MIAKNSVRMPFVAGQFYEGDPERLRENIESMLSDVRDAGVEKDEALVRAAILPHAGYFFSGRTALRTLLPAEDFHYRNALVIAPVHRIPCRGIALGSFETYRTPLGDIPVDTEAVGKIRTSGNSDITDIDDAHRYEHALEVELPLLQLLHPDISIIPVMCGRLDENMPRSIAGTLGEFWNSETLWIISSDFTHYGEPFGYVPFTGNIPENIEKLDMGAIEKILDLDLNAFSSYMRRTGATICGADPIRLLLAVALDAGGLSSLKTRLVEYTTSGHQTGDFSHCVSYAGITVSDKF